MSDHTFQQNAHSRSVEEREIAQSKGESTAANVGQHGGADREYKSKRKNLHFSNGDIDHDHDANSFHSWWDNDEEVDGEEGGKTSGVESHHSRA
jgi:hypothetical protein